MIGFLIKYTKLFGFIVISLFEDSIKNSKLHKNGPYILIIRDVYPVFNLRYNHHFLNWVAKNCPKIFRHIRYGRVTPYFSFYNLKDVKLVLFWNSQKNITKNQKVIKQLSELEKKCDSLGIKYINSTKACQNIIKSNFSSLARSEGFNAARIIRIDISDTFQKIKQAVGLPFFIRDDYEHGNSYHVFVNAEKDLNKVKWGKINTPIAVEFIDVKSMDGLYRKYRYFCIGNYGAIRHLLVSDKWFLHAKDRIKSEKVFCEEKKFLENFDGKFHDEFNLLRKKLNLDYVVFDYSENKDGKLVIWEPNVRAIIWDNFNRENMYYEYQLPTVYNIYKTMIRYYLESAELEELVEEIK